jgi:sugar/nucleoside kinase (ribokinase family)
MTLAIASNCLINRLWSIGGYGSKNRINANRDGGGFCWGAQRQAKALGFATAVLTAVGNDGNGVCLRRQWAVSGANLAGLRVQPLPTMTAEVIVSQGQRTVLIDEGMRSAEWAPDDTDGALVCASDALVVGGSLPDTVLASALAIARRAGKPVFVNPTRLRQPNAVDLHDVRLVQVSRDDFPNFGAAPNAPAAALAQVFLDTGCEAVVVTDSANGEWSFDQLGHSVRMPAVPERRPFHPTGCGDATFVAHIAGILLGLSMYDWLNLGTLAGAFYVECGHPATWRELNAMGRDWPPEKRM